MGDSLGWLSKLSQLVGGGGSKPRGDFWVDDSKVKNCYDCETAFSVFVRKHHCRVCGRIFCGNCTKNFLPAPDPSSGESWMRVCNYCESEVVLGWQHFPIGSGREQAVAGVTDKGGDVLWWVLH